MNNLVVLSLERWDDVWRRNQYLVDGLLSADSCLRVLFVEPADDPLHALRSGNIPEFGHPLRMERERLWTFAPMKALPRRMDRRADERLAHSAIRAARMLAMQDPVLWINDPATAAVARLTGWRTLYDITDDWLAADRPPRTRERIQAAEGWLLDFADEVVACSAEIIRRKSSRREGIRLVQNAVDLAAYRTPRPRPADLPDGPVALYLGTLHSDRLDVDLCAALTHALAGHARVALVGPNLLDASDTEKLRRADAVLLGARPRDEVIGYLQHADVLLVPHRVTPFTDSLDPLKLYEYQAIGARIVSTPVAGFREAPGVHVAAPDQFPEAVRRALVSPPAPRVAVADWSDRVDEVRGILQSMGVQR